MTSDRLREKNQNSSSKNRARLDIDPDQDLLVFQDLDNGNEYFFYKLDAFRLDGKDYICLASYEPDFGDHSEPELVIMSSYLDKNKQRVFKSIRKDTELEKVFEVFYKRMEKSIRTTGNA